MARRSKKSTIAGSRQGSTRSTSPLRVERPPAQYAEEALATLRKALTQWHAAADPGKHGVYEALTQARLHSDSSTQVAVAAAQLMIDQYWAFRDTIERIARLAGATVVQEVPLASTSEAPSLFNK